MNVGDRIPEVFGIDQDGREVKRSDFAGRKLILYSYPKANTSGCTAEACSLQAHKAELEAKGYAIVGISKGEGGTGVGVELLRLKNLFKDLKTVVPYGNMFSLFKHFFKCRTLF